jgi:Site-specific recombinase XerD
MEIDIDKAKTLNEIYPLWYKDHEKFTKKSTMGAYALIANKYVLPAWGDKKIITREIAEEQVIKWGEQGLSRKTIQDFLIVVKMLLGFASEQGWQPYYKFTVRFPNSEKRRELKRFSGEQMKKLINYCIENYNNKNLGILITALTGMRIGEICGLRYEDIDIDEGVIYIKRTIERVYYVDNKTTELIISTPKTQNSYRSIPICNTLMKILKPLLKISNPQFYVISNCENPTEPRTYRNYFAKTIKKINLPQIKFHGLRHSFASIMIENKADVKTVATILGHADIQTTLNLYCHPTKENKRNAINKIFKI